MRLAVSLVLAAATVAAAGAATAQTVTFRDEPAIRLQRDADFSAERARADDQHRPRIRIGPADDGVDAIAFGGATAEQRLRAMGVRDGAEFRDRGRLYLFAADGETAVGYNVTRSNGGWSREGLSLDDGAFVGDAQAGVAWRQGSTQTSLGYVHREVKREGRIGRDREEAFVALQFSWTPGR